jgi:hypothetical protein
MLALGLQSRREITRTRIRVRTAMAAQTCEQGRYVCGCPRWAGGGSYPVVRRRGTPDRKSAANKQPAN